MESPVKAKDGSVADLLTMFDRGRQRGFITRTCYYCFVAAGNQTRVEYPSLESLHQLVLENKRVQDSVQQTIDIERTTTDKPDCNSEIEAKKKAECFAKGMIGTVTSRVIRFCGWIYLVLLRKVCGSVQFCPAQLQAVQEAASSEVGLPIIYMPLHYSHLDYILLSLVLFHNNIRVPYIASGDNLHLPLIGFFIKRAGGFFIRRKLDENNQKDLIYRAVLQAYITEILKSGQSMEVFLEGTRSRSGLPNVPKTGLLSVLVETVIEKEIGDALIVPVHTSYEKLLEGNFSNELSGKSKKAESLWHTLKSVFKILFGHYGSIKINFAKPISLKAALSDICMSSSKNPSLSCLSSNHQIASDLQIRRSSSPEVDMSWRKNISFLAEHIIFRAMRSSSFMSTHLVAFLLLNMWRNGVELEDLVASYCRLKSELAARGRDLGFSGAPRDVVLHALSLLGDKVITLQYASKILPNSSKGAGGAGDSSIGVESLENDLGENADSGIFFITGDADGTKNCIGRNTSSSGLHQKVQYPDLIIRPVIGIPAIFELSYYSNALTPVFAIESIICLSANAVTGFRFSMVQDQWVQNGGAGIFEDSLPDNMTKSFLRSALVDKALGLCDFLQMDLILCDVIVDIEDCIQDAVQSLILSGCFTSKTIGCSKTTHANYGIDEEENFGDDELLKVNLQLISQLLCHQSVLAPFVEALALVTEQLGQLENPMPRKEFVSKLIEVARNRTQNGLTTRIECCSSEVLSHCVRAFKSNQVLETHRDGELVLTEDCRSSSHLNKLLTRISQYLM